VKGKNAYATLEMNRFIAKHGMTKWKMNPKFPFNSITLQRMLAAVDSATRNQLIECLLPAIWEEQLDVADPEALGKVLQAGGFDAQDLFTKTQDPAVKQAVIDNVDKAVERGAFGIPTMYVGDEMFFGKERLGQIADLLSE